MAICGLIGVVAIRFFLWPDPDRSDTEHQLFFGFRPYLFGAAILIAVLGAALLRANGVAFGWPTSN